MLGSCVRAESMKLRRSPIWLAYLLLPAFSCFIGGANYSANLEVLTPGWENLWTQQTIFICYFFLPPLLGVGCSHLWRLEHAGANWNGLMCAPVSPGDGGDVDVVHRYAVHIADVADHTLDLVEAASLSV